MGEQHDVLLSSRRETERYAFCRFAQFLCYIIADWDDLQIDFQMNIFSSPAIDLHYFIATSTKIQVKLDHIEIILDHYYGQLIANLARLQYSLERVPSREQFKKDYNYRAFYGNFCYYTLKVNCYKIDF